MKSSKGQSRMVLIVIAIGLSSIFINKKCNQKSTEDQFKFDTSTVQQIEEKKQDSIRLVSLGGYELSEIDQQTKCNLTTGYFILNNIITDSADLYFLANTSAMQLIKYVKPEVECPYPVMFSSYIFMNKRDFESGKDKWIAMYLINKGGNFTIADWNLKQYRDGKK